MGEEKVLYKEDGWTITDIGKSDTLMVDNHESDDYSGHVDYPIRYDDGRVAYDNPHVIPRHIQDAVDDMFIKYK